MGIRKRGDKWLVTAKSGRDEFGMRRRVCRTVDSEEEAKRLDAKLQNDVYEGRHVKPSGESVPGFCQRYWTAATSRPRRLDLATRAT